MALMDLFRPSLNVSKGKSDPLVDRQILDRAVFPEDGSEPTDEQKLWLTLMNNRRTYNGSQADDVFGLGRADPEVQGPGSYHAPAGIAGSLAAPSFRQGNDDALLGDQVAAMLQGKGGADKDAFMEALARISGPIDEKRLAQAYGQLLP